MNGATFKHRSEHLKILSWLLDRCRANLSTNEPAQDYLHRNGIQDESVWAAFRVGVGDDKILDGVSEDDRARLDDLGLLPYKGPSVLWSGGVLIPTFHPENCAQPVGVIKLNYGQNKHAFATPPLGLACAADFAEHKRVVIADAPLLGMRLALAGAKGVAVAECPQALASVAQWLAGREVVFASYKAKSLAALREALPESVGVQVHTDLLNSNADTLKLLGILSSPVRPVQASLIARIMEYARARLANGQGMELLKAYGVEDPEFIQHAYQLGYLPPDFMGALDAESRRALKGKAIADSIVVPAFDAASVPVDLLFIRSPRCRPAGSSLLEQSAGLIAPRIATTFDEIIVLDSFEVTVRLFKAGMKNVLLVRGVEDAKGNAERLHACGVRVAKIGVSANAAEIAIVLRSAGIVCTVVELPKDISKIDGALFNCKPDERIKVPVAKPLDEAKVSDDALPQFTEKPKLVSHDPKTETAIFDIGQASYSVEVTADFGSRLQIKLQRGDKIALDRFDLAVEQQRRRFAMSAAMRTQVPVELIEQHLLFILDAAGKLQGDLQNPIRKTQDRIEITADERKEATEFLKRPDLLDAIAADLEALGLVGEERNKRLLYLTAVSRKLATPLSVALLSTSGAGKSLSIETIAALTAPEDMIHVSRLSDSALFYFDRDALHHKLLIVDESDALSREVIVALRVLQSRGALSQSHVLRDPSTGATTSHFVEARGPVAVLTSTAGQLDEQVLSRCFDVSVDESPEQTRRVLEGQRRMRACADQLGSAGVRAKIVRRHHNIQRMLEGNPVLIPFAARIQFPSSSIRHRREQERFLNLIEASALLHQHQRLKSKSASGETFIVADIKDFEIATGLAADSIGRAGDELSTTARSLLALIRASNPDGMTMDDLKALRPDWTRYRFRMGLDELLKLEILTSPRSGRGRVREYQLQGKDTQAPAAQSVRLLSELEVGELAKVGEVGFANFIPKVAIG